MRPVVYLLAAAAAMALAGAADAKGGAHSQRPPKADKSAHASGGGRSAKGDGSQAIFGDPGLSTAATPNLVGGASGGRSGGGKADATGMGGGHHGGGGSGGGKSHGGSHTKSHRSSHH